MKRLLLAFAALLCLCSGAQAQTAVPPPGTFNCALGYQTDDVQACASAVLVALVGTSYCGQPVTQITPGTQYWTVSGTTYSFYQNATYPTPAACGGGTYTDILFVGRATSTGLNCPSDSIKGNNNQYNTPTCYCPDKQIGSYLIHNWWSPDWYSCLPDFYSIEHIQPNG
jgi:hypothetical protein